MSYVETHGLYVRMFRADCGSFIKELVEELILRTDTFYLRAGSCADRRQMYEKCKEWRHTTVNCQEMLSHFTITFLPLMIYIPLGRLSADDATRCPCRL